MSETWEQTKARLKKQGIDLKKDVIVIPPVQYKEQRPEPFVKRFNIHKRSLPVSIDNIVVFNITKEEAEWWIEYKLKSKCYENNSNESKTVIYYDIVPINATSKERSVYFNTRPVIIEEFKDQYMPRRID